MDKYLELWNNAAEQYEKYQQTEDSLSFLRKYILQNYPCMHDMKVLDLACGSGNYDDIFSQQGAVVYGCDGAENMIELAKKKNPDSIFTICNICEKLPYESKYFDMVFSNMALMDLWDLSTVFREVYRVLKKGGRFFYSIVHPIMYTGEWVRDSRGNKTAYKLYNYLSEHEIMNTYWGKTVHFHRPLSLYINKCVQAGFHLKKLDEVCVSANGCRPESIPTLAIFEWSKEDRTKKVLLDETRKI